MSLCRAQCQPCRPPARRTRRLPRQLALVLSLALLGSGCRPRERFTRVDPQNPYIMFDQQTAQSCWSGPASSAAPASGEFAAGELTPEEAAELQEGETNPRLANPAHLPFCKDLPATK